MDGLLSLFFISIFINALPQYCRAGLENNRNVGSLGFSPRKKGPWESFLSAKASEIRTEFVVVL